MDELVREGLVQRVREMRLRVLEKAIERAEVDFATGVLGTTERRVREAIELCIALGELEQQIQSDSPIAPSDVSGMTRV